MILKTLKREFTQTLSAYYPETECEAFFNILAEDILKMKRVDIALNLYAVVSGKKYDNFEKAIKRLKDYQPIQYILGETEFYGLPFKVDEHTLIPRPETEELVDWILKVYSQLDSVSKKISILDIGTGSGCIAISLAKHLPHVTIYAMDVSKDALKVARQNAKLNNVDVTFIEASILDESAMNAEFKDLEFQIIVSNPPYVRDLEKAQMAKNVLDNEPHLALFVADENPLVFYKAITQFAVNNLTHNGKLFFEINEYLGQEMKALLKTHNFKSIELKKDLFGKDRMLLGKK